MALGPKKPEEKEQVYILYINYLCPPYHLCYSYRSYESPIVHPYIPILYLYKTTITTITDANGFRTKCDRGRKRRIQIQDKNNLHTYALFNLANKQDRYRQDSNWCVQ